MSRIIIRGGRVLDPAEGIDAHLEILVDKGVISGLFRPGDPSFAALHPDRVINARGMWVLPGFIDPHVHLRQPGMTDAEDVKSGTTAAAAGGYSTIVCMPNTEPVLDTPAVVGSLLSDLEKDAVIPVKIAAALSVGLKGKKSADLEALIEAGAFCWSDDGKGTEDPDVMAVALRMSEKLGRPVLVHAEDRSLSGNGVMRSGPVARRLGLEGIASASETVRVRRDIRLQQRHGGWIHFQHLSTAGSLEAVRRAKKRGQRVTCELTPHHLLLTDLDLEHSAGSAGPDPNFKMNPPLCRPRQRMALWEGLSDGTVDAIGTDHAPHVASSKNAGFARAPFGVVGLETSFALMLRLVKQGIIDLGRGLELLSAGPARVLGINAGSLAKSKVADLCLVDPDLSWRVVRDSCESKSFNTPFAGWVLRGRPVLVMAGGKVVWQLAKDGGQSA